MTSLLEQTARQGDRGCDVRIVSLGLRGHKALIPTPSSFTILEGMVLVTFFENAVGDTHDILPSESKAHFSHLNQVLAQLILFLFRENSCRSWLTDYLNSTSNSSSPSFHINVVMNSHQIKVTTGSL